MINNKLKQIKINFKVNKMIYQVIFYNNFIIIK